MDSDTDVARDRDLHECIRGDQESTVLQPGFLFTTGFNQMYE